MDYYEYPTVQLLIPGYNTKFIHEELEILLDNHQYNLKTDWEKYRRVQRKWRNRKQTS